MRGTRSSSGRVASLILIAACGRDITEISVAPPAVPFSAVEHTAYLSAPEFTLEQPIDAGGTVVLDSGARYPDAAPPAAPDASPEAGAAAEAPRAVFEVVGEPEERLAAALTTAIDWYREGASVPLARGPGQHTIEHGDKTTMSPGRLGQTAGEWGAAVIRVKDESLSDLALAITVAHEMGHVLARSNEHAATGLMSADPFKGWSFTPETLEYLHANER